MRKPPAEAETPLQPTDHEIRAWLSAIVESSSDAIIGSRLDGTIFSWNAGAEALYGYTAAEVIGRPAVAMLVPPDRRAELQSILDTLRSGHKIPAYETVRRTKDGRDIDVSITASPIISDGKVVGASAIARSIVERKRAEEALRDSEERLTSALLASETGTFRWYIQPDVLECDESLRQLYGVPPDRQMSRAGDFLAVVHPDDREPVLREIQRCVQDRAPFAAEFRIVRPDGTVRWIAKRARIFSDAPGAPPKYLTGACRDVTKRRGAEERLRTTLAEKEALLLQKDLLLKEVNHRVKNGLQMVAGLLSLQSRYAAGPEVSGQLDGAHRRVMTVARVHERLYQSEEIGIVELGQYLRGMCDDLVHSMAEAGHFDIAVDVPEIGLPADKVVLLGLVVNELVTNAMRHAYPDGRGLVQVSADLEGETLLLAVRDSGPGLPESFDPGRSLGFGMKLVRGLTQQLEATLEVERRTPGTEIRIQVPLKAGIRPAPGAAKTGASGLPHGTPIPA